MTEKPLVIYIVSDSVGETAEQVARAVIGQFDTRNYEFRRFPFTTDETQLLEVLEEAKKENAIIVFTMVINGLRDFLLEEAKKVNIRTVDIMTPLLDLISIQLDIKPKKEPGTIRRLDEKYFKKIEAIEFAVKYDDGKDPRGINKADIVLVGISRTSKTPLSMYLAHRNIKAANVPLVPEVSPPRELFNAPSEKIIGLTTNPRKLIEIRQERLKALGLKDGANYASMERILEELDYADKVMRKLGCPVIDVSTRAVEESASIIMEIFKEKGYKVGNLK